MLFYYLPILICTYVLISHSVPFGNPTGLIVGVWENSGALLGEKRGEYWFKDLHVPRIPICVLGNPNQSCFPREVDTSTISCNGNVKLKSRW